MRTTVLASLMQNFLPNRGSDLPVKIVSENAYEHPYYLSSKEKTWTWLMPVFLCFVSKETHFDKQRKEKEEGEGNTERLKKCFENWSWDCLILWGII